MIKHVGSFLFLAIILLACKGKRAVITTPSGPLEMLTAKEAEKAFTAKPKPAKWVQILSEVNVEQNGSNQNGRVELRMCQDSIIWVEIADPIIGFKAIRAFAMDDSIAYINRLDKTYFAGPYAYLEKKLGTSIPFNYAFKVFMGRLFNIEERPTIVDGHYVIEENMQDSIRFFARVEPINLDCVNQEFYTPENWIRITYADYREIKGYRYPFKIHVQVFGKESLIANFKVRELNVGKSLETPFKISSKYERVD